MNFKYYDILSHLVPGYLIIITTSILYKDLMPDISIVPQIAIAFVIGYINNTFSSWAEDLYRFLWGGNPINHFFDKNGIWKIRFYKGGEVKLFLKTRVPSEKNDSNFALFTEAMRIANELSTERLKDLNASYSFSRGILTSVIICFFICLPEFYDVLLFYPIVVALIVVCLIRCKQRNAYYIKGVLNIVLSKKENN
jgi:hypothetical protein